MSLVSFLSAHTVPLKTFPDAEMTALEARAAAEAEEAEEKAQLEREEHAALIDALALEDGKSTDWIGAVAAEIDSESGNEDDDAEEDIVDDAEAAAARQVRARVAQLTAENEELTAENAELAAQEDSKSESESESEDEEVEGDDEGALAEGDLEELQQLARAAASSYGEFASSDAAPATAAATAPTAASASASASPDAEAALSRSVHNAAVHHTARRWKKSARAATEALALLAPRRETLQKQTRRSDSKTGKKRSKRDRDTAQSSLRVATRQMFEMLLSRAEARKELGRIALAKEDVSAGLGVATQGAEGGGRVGAAVEGLTKSLNRLSTTLEAASNPKFALPKPSMATRKRARAEEEGEETAVAAEEGGPSESTTTTEEGETGYVAAPAVALSPESAAARKKEKKRAKKEKRQKRAPKPKIHNEESHAVWKAKRKQKQQTKVSKLTAAQIAQRKEKFAAKKVRRAAAKAAAAAAE